MKTKNPKTKLSPGKVISNKKKTEMDKSELILKRLSGKDIQKMNLEELKDLICVLCLKQHISDENNIVK